jgi:hypothetical protein
MPVSTRPSSQSGPSQFPPTVPRFIQIAAIPESDSHSVVLFALTDDGSIMSNVFNLTLNPPDWDGWQLVPWVPALKGRNGEPL